MPWSPTRPQGPVQGRTVCWTWSGARSRLDRWPTVEPRAARGSVHSWVPWRRRRGWPGASRRLSNRRGDRAGPRGHPPGERPERGPDRPLDACARQTARWTHARASMRPSWPAIHAAFFSYSAAHAPAPDGGSSTWPTGAAARGPAGHKGSFAYPPVYVAALSTAGHLLQGLLVG